MPIFYRIINPLLSAFYNSPFFDSAAGLAPKSALRSVSVLVWSYILVSIFRPLCLSSRATM